MGGRVDYGGSLEACPHCGRRLSRRSFDGIGCPFCADGRARMAPQPLRPKTGETVCLVSATSLDTLLPGHSCGSRQITLHSAGGDCHHLARAEASQTSVEAVEAETEGRSLSVMACSFCGEGLA